MKASPRISVLGESGYPCIVGIDHQRNINLSFLLEMAPLSPTVAYVLDIDNSDKRATETLLLQQETTSCRQLSIRTQSKKLQTAAHFVKTATHSARPVTQSAL